MPRLTGLNILTHTLAGFKLVAIRGQEPLPERPQGCSIERPGMLGKLVVIAGPDKDRSFPIEEGKSFQIGRGQNTETKLTDPQVSRVHCQLKVANGKAYLIDSGSTGGTLIAGKKIKEHELRGGEVIHIGGTQLRVHLEGSHEASTVLGLAVTPKPLAARAEQLGELVGQSLTHYRVDEIIAKGQQGMVFKAHDSKEDRTVALKVLWPEFSKNEEEMHASSAP